MCCRGFRTHVLSSPTSIVIRLLLRHGTNLCAITVDHRIWEIRNSSPEKWQEHTMSIKSSPGLVSTYQILNLNQNCKSEHKGLKSREKGIRVVLWQVWALNCYQNAKQQGECRNDNHSLMKSSLHQHSGSFKVTSLALRSKHITLTLLIANFILKSKVWLKHRHEKTK